MVYIDISSDPGEYFQRRGANCNTNDPRSVQAASVKRTVLCVDISSTDL